MKTTLFIFLFFLINLPSFAGCLLPNQDRIEILLWNVKEDRGIQNMPVQLADSEADFFLFQEASAYAINTLRDHLPGRETLTIHNGRTYGVGTLSRTEPCEAYTVEVDDEPVMPKIDKGIVVQIFKLKDGRKLKMINVHLPLFILSMSYGEGGYKKGLRALEKEVKLHQGPLILAGDFNGWTPNRTSYLIPEFVQKTGLSEVEFEADSSNRAAWLKLDRVFYRGVQPVYVQTRTELDVSDHYMREIEFQF